MNGSEIAKAFHFPIRLPPGLRIEIHNVVAECGCAYGQAVWNGHMVQRWYSKRCEVHSLRKKKVIPPATKKVNTEVEHLKKKILELFELRKTTRKKSKHRRAINARLLELGNRLNELDPNALLELQALIEDGDNKR